MKRLTPLLLVFLALTLGCASSDEGSTRSALPPPSRAPDTIAQATATRMTVGELLAKGGRQMTAAQVKALIPDAVMEGAADGTAWREMSFPDGKVTGQSKMGDGHVIDYEGSWWVDEQGRRCWANATRRNPVPDCVYLYLLDGKFYASESDASNKNATLERRRISK